MSDDTEHAPPLPGAAPLRQHIASLDISVPEWCERQNVDRFAVQKLLNGKLQRVSVELAFDIQEATEDAVPATLWIPTEEIRDAQREKRRAIARARHRAIRARIEAGEHGDA